ncbi:putative methyltransferase C9orf114 homolog [Mercenaria mercenaria]|uniref:putative methyltransferase C9orf114 homolog n=1 Tax=Mercenaria mercenaria TaxID=6596 RepID=UPI00234F024F|nr:putative methyltransferase C9orf114 homolog [Mercenaria mercenaria]
MESANTYARPSKEPPTNPKELKKWKEERKAAKRKWKEEKLLKQLAKKRQLEKKEEEAKKVKEEEEEVQERLGRPYTLSIALPGSILDNAQSPELRTYLAGQVGQVNYYISYTLSIALPGSILDNAQSPELRTYLAGQVRLEYGSLRIDTD